MNGTASYLRCKLTYCELEVQTHIRKEILTLESGRNNWSQTNLLLKLTTSSDPLGSSGDFNDMIIFMASNSFARSREWAENIWEPSVMSIKSRKMDDSTCLENCCFIHVHVSSKMFQRTNISKSINLKRSQKHVRVTSVQGTTKVSPFAISVPSSCK